MCHVHARYSPHLLHGAFSGSIGLVRAPRRNPAHNLFCASVRNDFVSDRRNESENGGFSVTLNDQPRMPLAPRSTTQKLPLTTYASFGPFSVHSVAKTFVDDRHVAKRATTGSSPTSVRYPQSHGMTGSTASNVLPCRSRRGASFLRPFTHASHHAAWRCVNSSCATSSGVGQ